MKRELWKAARTGDLVVYADRYDGVFRAKIVEVDIHIYEKGAPSSWGYPYGKTAESGTVKLEYETLVAGRRVKQQKIENLMNLIVYSAGRLGQLKKKWNLWQVAKSKATDLEHQFLVKIEEYKKL